MMFAQTTMIAPCLAILIYIAIVISGNLVGQETSDENLLNALLKSDTLRDDQISKSLNYVHKSDTGMSMQNVLLNGINLSEQSIPSLI